MHKLDQEKIIELFKKLEDSSLSPEERLALLKAVNLSMLEFNSLLKEIKLAVKINNKKDKRGDQPENSH